MIRIGAIAGSRPQHVPQKYAAVDTKPRPELLELRSGWGTVYLLPSRWERIRLQWAFRHFHELCPEVLSRGDRRLIEKLRHSGVVRPRRPVPREQVFGVIERAVSTTKNSRNLFAAEARPLAAEAGVQLWPEAESDELSGAASLERSAWESVAEGLTALRGLAVSLEHSNAFQQWRGLTLLSAVCLALVLAKVCGVPLNLSGTQPSPSTPAPMASVAGPATRALVAPVPAPSATPAAASRTAREQAPFAQAVLPAERVRTQHPRFGDSAPGNSISGNQLAKNAVVSSLIPDRAAGIAPGVRNTANLLPLVAQRRLDPIAIPASSVDPASEENQLAAQVLAPVNAPAAAVAAAVASPVASSMAQDPPSELRPFISEMPQGRVPYPVVSDRNFVGMVTLRAVIGNDGQVKNVSVLSGDPKVAQAAVAAVKQWRYAPAQAGGRNVEAETKIGISFFGRDAVSITSPQ